MTETRRYPGLADALPFWASLLLLPILAIATSLGGWALMLMPLCTWYLFGVLDRLIGDDTSNLDPTTPDSLLVWHRAITLIWAPLQSVAIFGTLAFVSQTDHLAAWEQAALFFGVGILSGTVGIVYAHELMHQPSRYERWLADILLAMVLYSHFRSEHLLVHHRYVATPRDAVSARYNEGFYRFFARVLPGSLISAWNAEAAMLARRGEAWWSLRNPFWRYDAMQLAFCMLSFLIGGWAGLGLFLFQAFVAIWQLELVNYVEHYGLTRKHLGEGRYEQAKPRHSWNAAPRASNALLINLQRHSDHHARPDRCFPLLQTYSEDEAPVLPRGYPLMTVAAMIPPLWRRIMNPQVRAWRRKHYPEIDDWTPYKAGTLPLPK
ncbi:MAG: alkane 1-monooxygenase [Pseudomonadota bacterium]